MVNGARPLRRDRTAIACSIAIHCCVLVALATVVHAAVTAPEDPVVLTSMIRLEPRPPQHATHVQRAAAASPAVRVVAEAPVLHVARTNARLERTTVVPSELRYRPQALSKGQRTAAPPASPVDQSALAAQPGVAHADETPASAAPSAAPVVAQHEDGIGNFSENYPAQVDPQARSGLFEGVAGSVVLRVEIDETGRVTSIAFVRAPADPALKDALRNRILATRFIPAACNGLRCSDTIELKN
jgi:TonB family protein